MDNRAVTIKCYKQALQCDVERKEGRKEGKKERKKERKEERIEK